MAERIVDVLEAVQIDQQQRQLAVMDARVVQGVRQQFEQQRPVGQAGEVVMPGQVRHPHLHRARLAHILEHHDAAHHLAGPVV
ncbi:MAG TPA: hypothetical protein VEB23_13055, partial [Ramlibacter sp.]|nr:hypothetical protein [Ramlibacter sp.]